MSRKIIRKLRRYRISLDDRWLDRQSDGETLAMTVRTYLAKVRLSYRYRWHGMLLGSSVATKLEKR